MFFKYYIKLCFKFIEFYFCFFIFLEPKDCRPEWLVKYCQWHFEFFTVPNTTEFRIFMDESFEYEGCLGIDVVAAD